MKYVTFSCFSCLPLINNLSEFFKQFGKKSTGRTRAMHLLDKEIGERV